MLLFAHTFWPGPHLMSHLSKFNRLNAFFLRKLQSFLMCFCPILSVSDLLQPIIRIRYFFATRKWHWNRTSFIISIHKYITYFGSIWSYPYSTIFIRKCNDFTAKNRLFYAMRGDTPKSPQRLKTPFMRLKQKTPPPEGSKKALYTFGRGTGLWADKIGQIPPSFSPFSFIYRIWYSFFSYAML